MATINAFQEQYRTTIIPALMKEFGITNAMRVPKLAKVVINTGLKQAVQDGKIIDAAVNDLTAITGQKATITRAKKSIANFKLREGLPIGVRVTLRRERMYDFLQRLVTVALPRVRDFKGVSPRGFDGQGNYTLGLTEHVIFSEIDVNKLQYAYGMNVTFVTTAKSNQEGRKLLELFGIPFRN